MRRRSGGSERLSLAGRLPQIALPRLDDETLRGLLPQLAIGCRSFADLRRASWLAAMKGLFTWQQLQTIEREVPEGIEVPSGSPASSTRIIFPPLISITVPAGSSFARVSRCSRAIEAIEGSASPRNPRVATLSRSSLSLIFEVAWRSKASMASSRTMPQPLSVIWMTFLPPAST